MTRRVKVHHAPVIRALHSEIRRMPGGFEALGEMLGRNAGVLRNYCDPAREDSAPSLEVFLDAIEAIVAVATVRAVAALAGMTAVPVAPAADFCPRSAHAAFMRVVKEMGDVQSVGGEALEDGRFDAAERVRMDREVSEAISHLVAFQAWLRGA